MAGMIAMARTAPVAEPEAFFLPGPLAIPSLTGVALVDGLLLGKVALLKGNSLFLFLKKKFFSSSKLSLFSLFWKFADKIFEIYNFQIFIKH